MTFFETDTAEQTQALGRRMAAAFRSDDVVGLWGELGTGKTTLIKGIAAGLDVKEVVKSPSFVVVTTYTGRFPIHHVDLYRIQDVRELESVGFVDLFGTGLVLVEWADRAQGFLPASVITVRLEAPDATHRRIVVAGDRFEKRLDLSGH